MPSEPTTSSWRFPPRTREVQFDEKWAFVFQEQAHCDPTDPADADRGDDWDHVAFDPEHKPVVSVVPGDRSVEDAQYVGTFEDPASPTYGNRYVFGVLDQTQVSGNIRFNVSFTPNVSLQMFVQPLIARGDYHSFKELKRQRSYDFLEYGQEGSTFQTFQTSHGDSLVADPDGAGSAPPISMDNPDFNFKSLVAKAVFRWEWRPGSTFYVAWTQDRFDDRYPGSFKLGRDARALFRAPADDVFLVKTTYWFSR